MNERPTLTFPEAVQLAASRFFEFTGRSRRSEYWWVMLALAVLSAILPVAVLVFDILAAPLTFRRLHDTGRSGWWYGGFLIFQYLTVFVGILFVGISIFSIVTMGLSALALLPMALAWAGLSVLYRIVLLIFLCQDSDPGDNQYGPSPKYEAFGE